MAEIGEGIETIEIKPADIPVPTRMPALPTRAPELVPVAPAEIAK
jgi:hypothetical protein